MQRRFAAIAFQLDAGLGAVDQLPGLGRIERRPGQCDVLHQFDIDAASSEQHHRPHFGIERVQRPELQNMLGVDRVRIPQPGLDLGD